MKYTIMPITSSVGGCCGKIESELLDEVLDAVSVVQQNNPNLLQGYSLREDCAIYQLNEMQSVAVSLDFMHPPVLEAELFGRIAACNAISDIYTLGIFPHFCLSILGFPDGTDIDMINAITTSSAKTIQEAGAIIVGGHTIRNHDFLCGFAVFSIFSKSDYWDKTKIKPGDQIILTKPIGTGIVLGARKKAILSFDEAEEAIIIATELNDKPIRSLKGIAVSGATDITGFGLIGHAYNLASSTKSTFRFFLDSIPIMDIARKMHIEGVQTGLTDKNKVAYSKYVSMCTKISDCDRDCLYDPQTSGGLMICIPKESFDLAVSHLENDGVFFKHIGYVTELNEKYIEIV